VILGIVKATTVSVKNANYSQGQTKAVSLAQEKISEIITSKNDNPKLFFENLVNYNSLVTDGQFCLKTTLEDISPSLPPEARMANIKVIVYWGENGAGTLCEDMNYLHNYQVQTNVTN